MVATRPNELGSAIVAVLVTMASIATVAFALRVYVQLKLLKRHTEWEDYLAATGWLLFMVYSGLTAAAPFYGLGKHTYPVPPEGSWFALELTYFNQLTFILTQMASKQSISLMLLRYAVEDYHRKLIYIVTFCLHIYSIVMFLLVMFQCMPVSFNWTKARGDTDGRCMDPELTIRAAYGFSAMYVVYDLTMAIIPWFMVRKLQLDLRTRLMVTTILAFGSITCVVVIVRVPFIVNLGQSTDWLYSSAAVSMLSSCETGLTISISCAATLRPLFRKMLSQSTTSSHQRTPKLATIPTDDGSYSAADTSTKQSDIEFSKAFYGSIKAWRD